MQRSEFVPIPAVYPVQIFSTLLPLTYYIGYCVSTALYMPLCHFVFLSDFFFCVIRFPFSSSLFAPFFFLSALLFSFAAFRFPVSSFLSQHFVFLSALLFCTISFSTSFLLMQTSHTLLLSRYVERISPGCMS